MYQKNYHMSFQYLELNELLDKMVQKKCQFAFMEVSSHALDQQRVSGCRFAGAVFTNLTQDHLDYHADFEEYRAAKLRLFTELAQPGMLAVVNADSPETPVFEAAAHDAGLKLMSVGWRGADLKIRELSPRATGQVMDVLEGALGDKKAQMDAIRFMMESE